MRNLRPVFDEPTWPEQSVHGGGNDKWKGVEPIKECFGCTEVALETFRKFSDSVTRPYLAYASVTLLLDANETGTYKDTDATESQSSGQSTPIAIPRTHLVTLPRIAFQGIHPIQKSEVYAGK